MSKFTDEEQVVVDRYKVELLRVAATRGYRGEAAEILATADRAFRDPHASEAAAETYLFTGLPQTALNLVPYNKREEAREVLKGTFAAGWDARGSHDTPAEPNTTGSQEPVTVPAPAEAPVEETAETKRRWF